MPLIVICGHPCSGKSTIASKLAALLDAQGILVVVIDEPSLHLTRASSYQDNFNEKNARGNLKSTVERGLNKKDVTILDSLNYIKGYRYELWCIARAVGTRYCMVHVDTPIEQCREWNATRNEEGYPSNLFEDLVGRFERPDGRNRWDSPLFTVTPGAPDEEEVLTAAVAAVVGSEESMGHASSRSLKPTMATTNPSLSGTNVLHEIDQATQSVISAIMDAQGAACGGAAGIVTFTCCAAELELKAPVTLADLRRHKRAFMKLATKITFARLSDSEAAARMFVDYLRDNLAGG